MDKPRIKNIDYIKFSLNNITQNSDINFNQINELLSLIDNASKKVILPIITIQKKLKSLMSQYMNDYSTMKTKAEESMTQLTELNDDIHATTMTISSIAVNRSKVDDHNKLILLFEAVTNNIALFDSLANTKEYNNIISAFNQLTTDEDLFEPNEELNLLDKEIKLKKIKKKKKKLTTAGSSRNNKAFNQSHKKDKKEKSNDKDKDDNNDNDDKESNNETKSNKKKGKADNELLELIQKEYPTSVYIQKLSRTFLRRRLFKKVIYINQFTFDKNTQSTMEDKLKSSGDSTIYKYGKFTFDFESQQTQKQYATFISFFEGYLKHSFVQSDSSLKTITMSGKISLALNDLINQVFRGNGIYQEHNVHFVKIEFYEFYEELVSEFNPKEKNIKINCDEKLLKQLHEDWKGLVIVREYVENHRKNEN